MVFHPSHRPLEIATRFPQFHSPDDDDISPTNKKHKGTLLSSYRGGHFYWALTVTDFFVDYLSIFRYKQQGALGTRGTLGPLEQRGRRRGAGSDRPGIVLDHRQVLAPAR